MYLIVMCSILCQAESKDDQFIGKVESRGKSSLVVHQGVSGTTQSFQVGGNTRIQKDGESRKLSDVKQSDFVAVTWKRSSGKVWAVEVDIRPTLLPNKLAVGDSGFLPPQDDNYFFKVKTIVDDETVLVEEMRAPAPSANRSSARRSPATAPRALPRSSATADAELFLVSAIKASDFVEGKRIALDGKYNVAATRKATITMTGDKVTVVVERDSSQKTDFEAQGKVNAKGRAGSGPKVDVEAEADAKGKTSVQRKSEASSTSQRKISKEVSAFVLKPVSGGS
jgi:hypothetical protein